MGTEEELARFREEHAALSSEFANASMISTVPSNDGSAKSNQRPPELNDATAVSIENLCVGTTNASSYCRPAYRGELLRDVDSNFSNFSGHPQSIKFLPAQPEALAKFRHGAR